jgi:hypothetical protein
MISRRRGPLQAIGSAAGPEPKPTRGTRLDASRCQAERYPILVHVSHDRIFCSSFELALLPIRRSDSAAAG